MDSTFFPLVLVVVAGPQASGKSAVATALSEQLREHGELVALVELDQIAAMALPTLPTWTTAHRIFESVTAQWARSELTCVIAEGPGSRDEVAQLIEKAPPLAVVVTVVTTAPFEVALSRARADPTRGASREYDFLSKVYERWATEIALMDADVQLDTNDLDITQSVERIEAAIRSARDAWSRSF